MSANPRARAAEQLVIGARFSGPPRSGNGGYVAGRLAALLADDPVEVTLRAPVPVDCALAVLRTPDGLELRHGDGLIASARYAPLALEVPGPVSWAQAVEASRTGGSEVSSHFGSCFVCGRARLRGDGLQVWADLVPGTDRAAAAWIPDAAFADRSGALAPEHLWGALDCPGARAVMGEQGTTLLTGRMHGETLDPARAGERCIVMGWPIGADGRKRYSGTAVFGEDGRLLARALTTWIEVRRPAAAG